MNKENETITIAEATKEVEVAITRLALMHLSFSKILVDEFGKEKGENLIIKAIDEYGRRVGELIKRGESDLPKFGVHKEITQDNKGQYIIKGCKLAEVFKEWGELDSGRLYCYIDPVKSMTIDISQKVIHRTCEACGDDKCTLAIVSSTIEDKKIFLEKNEEIKLLDPYLV